MNSLYDSLSDLLFQKTRGICMQNVMARIPYLLSWILLRLLPQVQSIKAGLSKPLVSWSRSLVQGSVIVSRIPRSFCCRMVLDTEIWVPDIFVATIVLLLLGLLS